MDSSKDLTITPRRSQRLLRSEKDTTPAKHQDISIVTRGPRSMAKHKKAIAKLNQTAPEVAPNTAAISAEKSLMLAKKEEVSEQVKDSEVVETDSVFVDPLPVPDPSETSAETKKKRKARKRGRGKKNSSNSDSDGQLSSSADKSRDQSTVIENVTHSSSEENHSAPVSITESEIVKENVPAQQIDDSKGKEIEESVATKIIVPEEPKKFQEIPVIKITDATLIHDQSSTVSESPEIASPVKKVVSKPAEKDSSWIPQEPMGITGSSTEDYHSIETTKEKNETDISLLMDESIILVPDTPPKSSSVLPKDSTFSPVVDTSIHDSRPIIDVPEKAFTPLVKSVALRTSTPYAQRTLNNRGEGTPKRSLPAVTGKVSSMVKAVTIKHTWQMTEEELADTSEIKINPLEKSILKSSRRKRSMSVTESESFVQKRVMFNSPKIMEIETIDKKMQASFIEEKENAMMRLAASSSRRKRSLSTGTPSKGERQKSRVKMPNFKAIHEHQFERMESIADHATRKAERAKKMTTPVRDAPAVKPSTHQLSKIPTFNLRKPLVKVPSIENAHQPRARLLKRSMSDNTEQPPTKKIMVADKAPQAKKQIAVVSGLQRAYSETSKITVPQHAKPIVDLKKKWNNGTSSQTSSQMNRSKVEDRREKNMSLFKSKTAHSQAADQRAKNSSLLKGVRLNRRFELQMQHRQNCEDA